MEFFPDPFKPHLSKYYVDSSIIFQIIYNNIMKMHEKNVRNSLEWHERKPYFYTQN